MIGYIITYTHPITGVAVVRQCPRYLPHSRVSQLLLTNDTLHAAANLQSLVSGELSPCFVTESSQAADTLNISKWSQLSCDHEIQWMVGTLLCSPQAFS